MMCYNHGMRNANACGFTFPKTHESKPVHANSITATARTQRKQEYLITMSVFDFHSLPMELRQQIIQCAIRARSFKRVLRLRLVSSKS